MKWRIFGILTLISIVAINAQDQAPPATQVSIVQNQPATGKKVRSSSTMTRTSRSTGKPIKIKTDKIRGMPKFRKPKHR